MKTITAAEYRSRRVAGMTEDELLTSVRGLARTFGWDTYHTHNSKHSEKGWPDLVLARGGVVLFRELKTTRGKVTEAQARWLERLSAGGLDAAVWRPMDLLEGRIERELRGRSVPTGEAHEHDWTWEGSCTRCGAKRATDEGQAASDVALAAAKVARDIAYSSTIAYGEALDALMRACGYVPAMSHELAKLIRDEDERAEMGAALLDLAKVGMPAVEVLRVAREFAEGLGRAAPTDQALTVGQDLSPRARRLADADGWAPHARMHRKTAAEYEQRASLSLPEGGEPR